ncbi:MAG: family 43 glycosylhydrolase [Bryobacterales bacterium]|nr:family 43 glycosylhydrolase [Bryobacterales bacterium]
MITRAKWLTLALALPMAGQQAVKTVTLKDIPIRDPFILADEKTRTYYLYAGAGARETGQPRGGLKAYKSKDLVTWAGPHIACVLPENFWGGPKGNSAVAPEVHLYKGRYYLFATFQNNERRTRSKVLEGWREAYREGEYNPVKGTQILGSDSPEGPFLPLQNRLTTPEEFRCLDGTLYVEDGTPYMVYVHSWLQIVDGAMEAIRLEPDLSASVGEPFYLFKGSDGPWLKHQTLARAEPRRYIVDGPFFYRTRKGRLLMLWSGYQDAEYLDNWKNGKYVQTLAYSESGRLRGPWRQLEPLLMDDSGHGMLFRSFDGRLIMVVHSPNREAQGLLPGRARLFEMTDTGDTLKIRKEL